MEDKVIAIQNNWQRAQKILDTGLAGTWMPLTSPHSTQACQLIRNFDIHQCKIINLMFCITQIASVGNYRHPCLLFMSSPHLPFLFPTVFTDCSCELSHEPETLLVLDCEAELSPGKCLRFQHSELLDLWRWKQLQAMF